MDEEEFSNVAWDMQDNKHDTIDPLSDITDSLNQPTLQQQQQPLATQVLALCSLGIGPHSETFRVSTSLPMTIQHLV